MDTKLIKLSIISILTLLACNVSKKHHSNDFAINKEEYVKSYKVAFVCGCINEGTKENFTNFIKQNKDLGLFTEVEVMSHQKVKEADSIGRMFSYKIKVLNYEDGSNKRPVVSRCIYYSLSKQIDSFATESYRQIKRQGN